MHVSVNTCGATDLFTSQVGSWAYQAQSSGLDPGLIFTLWAEAQAQEGPTQCQG